MVTTARTVRVIKTTEQCMKLSTLKAMIKNSTVTSPKPAVKLFTAP